MRQLLRLLLWVARTAGSLVSRNIVQTYCPLEACVVIAMEKKQKNNAFTKGRQTCTPTVLRRVDGKSNTLEEINEKSSKGFERRHFKRSLYEENHRTQKVVQM